MAIARRDMLKIGAACGALAAVQGKALAHGSGTVSTAREALLEPFSCNVEMWFRKDNFLQRISNARAAGFRYIEFWDPKKKAQQGISVEDIAERVRAEGITVTSISPGPPNIGDAGNKDAFKLWLPEAIALAEKLGTDTFNATGHQNIEGLTLEQMVNNYVAALETAIPALEAAGKMMVFEPYNPFNHPGHFINGVHPALEISRRVNHPRIKILWDLFHMQRTDGNLITHMTDGWDQVGYIQFADSPDRHEPGTGEVAYGPVLQKARELGYAKPFGAELSPTTDNAEAAVESLLSLSANFDLSVREPAPAAGA